MIGRLEGRLIEKAPESLVLDVGGVGYEVLAPLSTFFELPELGQPVRLRIHTYVREEALHREALAGLREVLGPSHPDTLGAQYYLARVQVERGEFAAAELAYLLGDLGQAHLVA